MRKTMFAAVLCGSALLSSCAAPGASTGAALDNPLYAEWYYNDLVQSMMNLEIQQNPIMKDTRVKAKAEEARRAALAKSQEANAKRRQGLAGELLLVSFPAQGQVLLLDKTLYLGADTDIAPSGNPHVYLSPVADPRGGSGATAFPDASAVDLGPLVTPYGASAYALPARDDLPDFRSVVIWDNTLKVMIAFTQLRAQE